MLLPLYALADAVEINGIYYNLIEKGKVAEVTKHPNKYTGDVVIPEKVTYNDVEYSVGAIGNSAFYGCSGLTSITIPNSVTSIGSAAFFDTKNLTSVFITDLIAWCAITFQDYSSNPIVYAQNIYIDGQKVKELIIPSGVTSIRQYAFFGYSDLTSITIPNSVMSIGNEAFQGCSALTSVTIPNSVTSIGDGAFRGCSGLTSITIPNSVMSIGSSSFSECSGLTSISIPNSVSSIGFSAFWGCSGLNSITIPNSVTIIERTTFLGCSGLASITIPNSVTSIEQGAFKGCTGLTSVTIPNSVTTIGDAAFSGCSGLTSVTIPNSVTSIRDGAFSGCSGLTSVTIPNCVSSIRNNVFWGCSGLTSITIPNSVTNIGSSAFQNCSGLTSITIPNSVTSIESQAFSGCTGLTSITIPNSMTNIEQKAFANCSKVEAVYCYAEKVPPTSQNAFADSYIQYATLHVPASAINSYQTTVPWSGFGAFKTIDGGEAKKCAKPTISYDNFKLTYNCETEGVEYISEIKDADIKNYYENSVSLSATYEISVYATKSGYDNSDVATATLVFTNATFTTEGTSSAKSANVNPVLIQANNGIISVEGADDGERIHVYTPAGSQEGSAISQNRLATINTYIKPGDIAIIKIGTRAVKVVMK